MAAFNFGVGEFYHLREPTTPENQPVVRMNQDTLYSGLVVDLSEPTTITLPKIEGRYQSMLVISQDHFMIAEATPGSYELTEENVGTRFALVAFRTFVDVNDPDDIAKAHAAQDGLTATGGGTGPFEAPEWDLETLEAARKAVNDLAAVTGFDARFAFGGPEDIRPVDFLVGAVAGWGGLPPTSAMYLIESVAENDGETPHSVTVNDVPVDAFWSVTVYNAEGYLEANALNRNSYNNVTAEPNEDGTVTLNFGGCDDERINCIPITPGWNYTVRLYEPAPEIISGEWKFPTITPAN